ncbi:MAG: RsmE family RNA methyltransferase [Spirochaetales bacterium]|nr:RsmE family RNA methyltransferase [Spirochaetales bacterium]
MRQFILPPSWDASRDGVLVLTGKDARRLAVVLRAQPGDTFPGLAPSGTRCQCEVLAARAERVELRVRPETGRQGATDMPPPDIRSGRAVEKAQPANAEPAPLPRIVLAAGILKGSKLDDVVRAATEAGAAAFVPLATERSVPRGEFQGRLARLRRVRDEALGQSGSSVGTDISDALPLADFLAAYPAGGTRLGVVFHETPLAKGSLHGYCTGDVEEIVACVGPEGGFSAGELDLLAAGGYRPAWLGPSVLRAQTAAVFALASIRILCLERASWRLTKSGE